MGYAPFAAGLYTNNRFGNEWFVLVGAALCGISAGIFWAAEAAIAIAYPEPWNKGKALGYWLTYRLGGQILGGAINLGLNADRNEAGKVSYTVFVVFIALQASGPLVGFLLNKPDQVQRKDGKKVELKIERSIGDELKQVTKLFFTKNYLLIVLWIGQAVFAEAVFFTYLASQSTFILWLFRHFANNSQCGLRYVLVRWDRSSLALSPSSVEIFSVAGSTPRAFLSGDVLAMPSHSSLFSKEHYGSGPLC